MASGKTSVALDKETSADVKKVSITVNNSPNLTDEIEILADSDYDACTVKENKVTFYSWKTAATSPFKVPFRAKSSGSAYKSFHEKTGSLFETSRSPSSETAGETSTEFLSNEKRIMPQDIVWAKHMPNQPYWPAYVKSTWSKYAYVCYISRTSFCSKTTATLKQKKDIICYSSLTVDGLRHTGLEYYKEKNMWDCFSDFYNAVCLAKTYLSLKQHNYFSSEQSVYELFNSDLPKFHVFNASSPPVVPAKQIRISRPTLKESDWVLGGLSPKNKDKTAIKHPKKNSIGNGSLLRTESQIGGLRDSAPHVDTFEQVLSFILDGKCNSHLEEIIEGSFPSHRMKYFHADRMNSQRRKAWELENLHPYFIKEKHQDDVMHYLRGFLLERQISTSVKLSLPRFLLLLFNVLYPEAILWALSKIRNISYEEATSEYMSTHIPLDVKDKIFFKNLTKQERKRMSWRIYEKRFRVDATP